MIQQLHIALRCGIEVRRTSGGAQSNVHSADGWGDLLKPVVVRYQGKVMRIYFGAD